MTRPTQDILAEMKNDLGTRGDAAIRRAQVRLIEALSVAIMNLENINSVTKKQIEDNPIYWGAKVNGASGWSLAEINRILNGINPPHK